MEKGFFVACYCIYLSIRSTNFHLSISEPELPFVEREKTANYIKLTIHKPPGVVELYNVTCSQNCGSQSRPANQSTVVIEFGPLNPYTDYTFTIRAITGNKSSSLYVFSRTEEAGMSSLEVVQSGCVVRLRNLVVSSQKLIVVQTLNCLIMPVAQQVRVNAE